MIENNSQSRIERRSFLTRLSAGMAAFAAAAVGSQVTAQAQSGANNRWGPARHELDDWFETIPGQHRFIFDTIEADAFGMALRFANNYFRANQSGYGLMDSDMAVVIVARHSSTPFAFNDAMWAKYGDTIAKRANFFDPNTKEAPKANLYYSSTEYGNALANGGTTIDTLIKRGAHFAVCQLATGGYAGAIATAVGSDRDRIYDELTSNLVANAHMVPAGIVAVNRAQERGYSFVNA